jgi:hypothetical protein
VLLGAAVLTAGSAVTVAIAGPLGAATIGDGSSGAGSVGAATGSCSGAISCVGICTGVGDCVGAMAMDTVGAGASAGCTATGTATGVAPCEIDWLADGCTGAGAWTVTGAAGDQRSLSAVGTTGVPDWV